MPYKFKAGDKVTYIPGTPESARTYTTGPNQYMTIPLDAVLTVKKVESGFKIAFDPDIFVVVEYPIGTQPERLIVIARLQLYTAARPYDCTCPINLLMSDGCQCGGK